MIAPTTTRGRQGISLFWGALLLVIRPIRNVVLLFIHLFIYFGVFHYFFNLLKSSGWIPGSTGESPKGWKPTVFFQLLLFVCFFDNNNFPFGLWRIWLFVSLTISGQVADRMYRAELPLQGRVATERCHWEVKSNEPVLTLVKQEQGRWERLLRIKVAVQWQQLLFWQSFLDHVQ